MRKSTTHKLDKKKITIYELRVKDIRQLMESGDEINALSDIDSLLPMATDLKLEDFEELAPSEIKELWKKFKEVNADFFDLARKMGLEKLLKSFIDENLTEAFADLFSSDTPELPTTDGDST